MTRDDFVAAHARALQLGHDYVQLVATLERKPRCENIWLLPGLSARYIGCTDPGRYLVEVRVSNLGRWLEPKAPKPKAAPRSLELLDRKFQAAERRLAEAALAWQALPAGISSRSVKVAAARLERARSVRDGIANERMLARAAYEREEGTAS